MLQNTASAQEFIIVVGVKIVMTEDLLLLRVLGVGLEERVEPRSRGPLGWELLVVRGTGLRSAIAH